VRRANAGESVKPNALAGEKDAPNDDVEPAQKKSIGFAALADAGTGGGGDEDEDDQDNFMVRFTATQVFGMCLVLTR